MNSITIITIVVVALSTLFIFWLLWLGYNSCLKAYRIEASLGKHDEEILKEYKFKKKDKKGMVRLIGSYLALIVVFGLFTTGIVYKANGENIIINNQTVLVIKSGSMSDFYDDKIAESLNYDRHLQFGVGDICMFESNFEDLIEGEVYGYQYKNIIITHRLVSYDEAQGLCKFRGDNNSAYDGLVPVENITYHYTGKKVPGIGAFVLYAQSYFGIWSLLGACGVAVSSEVVYYKIRNIDKTRYIYLCPEAKKEPKKGEKHED